MALAAFGLWVFAVWRLAGMPDPGFTGRIIPAAWLLVGLLNGRSAPGRWFLPMTIVFTIGAWLWMLHPSGWIVAAAIPVAGLVAWGVSVSRSGHTGVIRGVVPLLLLSLLTTEITGDEVRFAEVASVTSGIPSERFGEMDFRPGDISREESNHTPVFPLLIAPGLLAGDNGLRIVPVMIALFGVLLLARLTDPRIAVAAALLYPGFGVLGLAMTGWLALGLFTLGVLLPSGKLWSSVRFLIALFLVAVKMRYAGLAVGIVIVEYVSIPTGKGKWLLPALVATGGILILVIDRFLLGGVLFWLRYGNIEALRLIWVNLFHYPLETLSHAGWSLFDPEAGLVMRAPWVLAAIPGLVLFRRRSPLVFRRLFIPSIVYWAFLIVWSGSGWHGLPAPVGRMFLPMLPLLACGLSCAWEERGTRMLVAISMAVTGLVTVIPNLRYNYADGTDTLLTTLGSVSGISMVRDHPWQLLIPVLLISALLLVPRRSGGRTLMTLTAVLAGALLLVSVDGVLEAEDLPPGVVQGAQLYPAGSDPLERYFWLESRERMLVLGEPGQSILLPGVTAGDTLMMKMSGEGGVLSIGTQLLTVDTPLIAFSSSYNVVGKPETALQDRPENRAMETFAIPLENADVMNGTVRIWHHTGPPVYMDEMSVSHRGAPE